MFNVTLHAFKNDTKFETNESTRDKLKISLNQPCQTRDSQVLSNPVHSITADMLRYRVFYILCLEYIINRHNYTWCSIRDTIPLPRDIALNIITKKINEQ